MGRKSKKLIPYFKSRTRDWIFQIVIKAVMVGGIVGLNYSLKYIMKKEKIPYDYNGQLMIQAQREVYKEKGWGDVVFPQVWEALAKTMILDQAYNQRVRATFKRYFELAKKNKYPIYNRGWYK